MTKTRTFPQTVKRFLEPVRPVSLYMKSVAMAVYSNSYVIYSILLLQSITADIESGNEQKFQTELIIFSVVTVVFYIGMFFMRRQDAWTATFHRTIKHAHRIYMDRFIALDNNKTESIGTGRLISIIDK